MSMSMNRRSVIKLMFGASVGTAMGQSQVASQQPSFRFGVIADPQYVDAKPSGSRHYRETIGKLENAITGLNKHELKFVVTLGDVIDRDFKSFAPMMKLYSESKAPRRFVLGNHDFSVAEEKKSDVPKVLGMEARYFSEVIEGIRFLYLDSTDVSLFAQPKEDAATQQALKLQSELKESGLKHIHNYNAAVGEKQLQWVRKELQKAALKKQKVLVFSHLPVMPLNHSHNLWNDAELVKELEASPQFVAYMNGHNHKGNYVENKGRHYLNFKGMVETAKDNAYSVVSVYNDRIEIDGFGLEPDRSLK